MDRKSLFERDVHHVMHFSPSSQVPKIMSFDSKTDAENVFDALSSDVSARSRVAKSGDGYVVYENGEVLSIAHGIVRSRGVKKTVPYVAVSLDGALNVDVFQKRSEARKVYNSIKTEYTSSSGFEEIGTCFSVGDDVSVSLGNARVVGDDWKVV